MPLKEPLLSYGVSSASFPPGLSQPHSLPLLSVSFNALSPRKSSSLGIQDLGKRGRDSSGDLGRVLPTGRELGEGAVLLPLGPNGASWERLSLIPPEQNEEIRTVVLPGKVSWTGWGQGPGEGAGAPALPLCSRLKTQPLLVILVQWREEGGPTGGARKGGFRARAPQEEEMQLCLPDRGGRGSEEGAGSTAGILDHPDPQVMGDVLFLFFQEPVTWLKYKFRCVLSYISETILTCTWQLTPS